MIGFLANAGAGLQTNLMEILNSLQSADVTNIADRVKSLADYMFKANVTPDVIQAAAGGVQKGIDGLNTGISQMDEAAVKMKASLPGLDAARKKGVEAGLVQMAVGRTLLMQTVAKMTEIRDAIPGAFEASRIAYQNTLEGMRPALEGIFQKGLNGGFRDMYVMVSILSGLAIAVLMFYNFRKREEQVDKTGSVDAAVPLVSLK